MVSMSTWIVLGFLIITAQLSHQSPSCTYGARGSLTSTCTDATPIYFRTTNYRFDNLDETVRCVSCNLQVIEGNTFDISGNQIKTLDLTDSQIQILKPKSFIGLVFVKRLLLPKNRITTVPADTFQGINKVQLLNLENNAITSLVQNGFKELANLEQLNLKNNRIKTIENGAFDGLASLEELDLGNNEIETVKDIFNGLLSVGLINLEGNKISQISPDDIKDLGSLLQLNLARNNLKTITANVFVGLPRLETLNLSSNPIDTLVIGSFRGLYSVEDVDMSNCAITDIQKGLLQPLHQLRSLDLSNNKLPTFTTGIYSGLPELRRLNLSHNKIEVYRKTGVFPLHSLHTLDLSFNNLKDLDYELLVDHLPSLSHLELNNNPWPCYLGKEMEIHFKHDGLVYTLGKEYDDPNLKCNDSRTIITPKEQSEDVQNSATAMLVGESNGHEYVLYIFMSISLGLMAFLFYLQYRNQKDIREIVGKSNISEVHLLSSSDLEAKDDY